LTGKTRPQSNLLCVKRDVKLYSLTHSLNHVSGLQHLHTMGVMNVGAPACGMNAAVRSFVRLSVANGYKVLGIRFGFEGLVQDNVS